MRGKLAGVWRSTPLRTRITALIVVTLTLGLVASGVGVFTLLNKYLMDATDDQISRSVSQITPSSIDGDQNTVATAYVVAHYRSNGSLIQANPPWRATKPDLPQNSIRQVDASRFQLVTVRNANGDRFRLALRQLPDNSVVVLGQPLDTINELLGRLLTLFCLFGIVVVVGGGFLTRVLLFRAFAPLRQVEETAAAIAAGDFGQRLGDATENTEVGRLNRSLNRMLNRIDTALSDRSRTIDQMRRFVSDASHELRTPLVSVRGYAELYRMGAIQSPEDVASAMDRIEREAIRLSTLVSDMLTLARLDEGISKQKTQVDLLALAQDAAMDARAQAPDRAIKVLDTPPLPELPGVVVLNDKDPQSYSADTETDTGKLARRARSRRSRQVAQATAAMAHAPMRQPVGTQRPVIYAEEDRIRQLLTNLIGNAIRYTPDGSPLEIAAYTSNNGNDVNLEVIDHGEGIPPQARQKIFERFWRAESSRGRDMGGSGLGLAIVAAIVNAHQGKIGLAETPGGGATFRVIFPNGQQVAGDQPGN